MEACDYRISKADILETSLSRLDYNMVKYAVPFAVIMIAVNIGIVIFIYLFTDMKLLKSVGLLWKG